MGAIEKKFSEKKSQGKKVFIAYITAGDPNLGSTSRLVLELEKNGADIIELGIPFSDPIADGPVNQEAAMRALQSGTTLSGVFGAVKEIRKKSDIPIVFFSYLNTILSYGIEKFTKDAKESGVDGALVLDLPPEESGEYKKLMDAQGLATIFLVSPITPDNRLELIAGNTSGFVYYVSQMGVTGERETVSTEIPGMVQRIRSHTNVPIAVGFGISKPEQVKEISQYADGVIVGSSIVRKIGENGSKPGFEEEIGKFVGVLTAPLQREEKRAE